MEHERNSGLQLYSLGIVVNNKPPQSDIIDVVAIEDLSFEEGKIEPDTRDFKTSLPDVEGVTKTTQIKGSAIMKAKWIPYGVSNRTSAPDVRKNETVNIYRYADTQEYYWTTLFREPEFRRLEHVVHTYSNRPEDDLVAHGPDDTYYVRISTRDKYVHLTTTDNDGEFCKYKLELNTKEGYFIIEDDIGNYLKFNSARSVLEVHMNNGYEYGTENNNENVAEKSIIDRAKENIERHAEVDIIDKADSSVLIEAPSITLKANVITLDAPMTIVTGHLEVLKDIHACDTIIDDAGNTPNHSH